MNGLAALLFMMIGAVGGWCAYALVHVGSRPMPPRPTDTVYRSAVKDWDQR